MSEIDYSRVTTRQGMGTTSVMLDGEDIGWFARDGVFYIATRKSDKKEFVCFGYDEAICKLVEEEK